MWRSGSLRCGLSRRGGAFLLLALGCGKPVALGYGVTVAGGSGAPSGLELTAGHAGGTGGTAAGSGEPDPIGAGAGGERMAESGAAGAPSEQDPRFFLVPGLAPPAERSPKVQPGDALNFELYADVISRDGSLIIGRSHYAFNRQDGRVIDEQGRDYVYWTAETGTRRWDKGDTHNCSTDDGSVVLGSQRRPAAGFYRWTREGGFEDLPSDEGVVGYFEGCSADGKMAAGATLDSEGRTKDALVWREAANGGRVTTLSIPGLGFPSYDGSAVLIQPQEGGLAGGAPLGVFRHTEASGVVALGAPVGYASCQLFQPAWPPTLMNQDASVLLLNCEQTAGVGIERIFRWSQATGSFLELPSEAPESPFWMSEDGATLVGFDGEEGRPYQAVRWVEGQPPKLERSPATSGYLAAASMTDDGKAAFFVFSPTGDPSLPDKALRWRESDGWAWLGELPGFEASDVTGYSADGSLAVGRSYDSSQETRAVLWDHLGIRDIAAELEAAGVDLQDVTLLSAERVWPGSPIVIQGTGSIDNYFEYSQIWFAQLPVRD